MVFERFKSWFVKAGAASRSSAADATRDVAQSLGDIWGTLQEIARAESPEVFGEKPVAQHAAETLEGKKDVERWLHAYRKRLDPDYEYRFPAHHERHRGHCLVPRHWPAGTSWDAFDESTFLRAAVAAQRTKDALRRALDEWLDARDATQ